MVQLQVSDCVLPDQTVSSEEPGDEQLAVMHPDGTPTGAVKARALVHEDGDWHRTRTVWVVLVNVHGGPLPVLQKRGPFKEAWPGRLDVSSAGHVRADDTDSWREVEEELGQRPGASEAIALGERRVASSCGEGRFDREIQELWLWCCSRDLLDLKPAYPEVQALLAVSTADLKRLVRGEAKQIPAVVRRSGPSRVETGCAAVGQLIPGDDAYFLHVCEIIERVLAGKCWTPYTGNVIEGRGRVGNYPPGRPCRQRDDGYEE